MKALINVFLIVIISTSISLAQPKGSGNNNQGGGGNGGGNSGGNGNCGNCVPVDNDIWVLALSGSLLGGFFLKQISSKKHSFFSESNGE